ncbi:acyl-CoA Delta-9 desaturase [Eupeodes corollae]|uniref:acyl-CoA Delta-9 desaturase n=1 Tax=Eupeodes corollae TaxID=290404 RepID=UPI002493775E|nr:acyl-CoA Delta-9 desaturase [Eupeodes corollae]
MPPTSSVETDPLNLTKVVRPQTITNNNDMCLSTPSESTTPTVCPSQTSSSSPSSSSPATCNNLVETSSNKCTNSPRNSCDNLRHRKHSSSGTGSLQITNNNNNNKALEAQDARDADKINQSDLDLSEDEKNEAYKERAEKTAIKPNDDASVVYRPRLRWPDLTAQVFLHIGALYGLYLLCYAKFLTLVWALLTIWCSGVGITAGVHRLWSHKSYTAALPLRLLLIFLFTVSGQRDAYTWALDHRIHHKFSETDADPHDARRGFFFAHVGWLFLTPHPKVEEKRKVIDMSDLENDGVVMFQRKWYIPLFALISIGIPVLVPCYFWNEDLWMSFWINFNMRFCATLNIAFFVNSVAHMWGRKPYDKNISPVESPFVSFIAMGEGWHNYHHVFPWDYKTSELGSYTLNVTTGFLDFCAKLGWVTGRKSVSPDMIARRAAKCGDGSHFLNDAFAHKDQVWGYGDKDVLKEDAAELATMID